MINILSFSKRPKCQTAAEAVCRVLSLGVCLSVCLAVPAWGAPLPPPINYTPIALPTDADIDYEWIGGSNTDTAAFTSNSSWSSGTSPYTAGGNNADKKGNVVIRNGDVLAQRIAGVSGGTNLYLQSSLTSGNYASDGNAHINNGGSINLLDGASMTYLLTHDGNEYYTNYMGNGSKGTFNIQNATLTLGMFLYLGREANQDATMNVYGPQAKVFVNGTLVNGSYKGRSTDVCGWGKLGGTATMNILDGAYVYAGNQLMVAHVGELKSDAFKPTTGYINVRNAALEVTGNILLGRDNKSYTNATTSNTVTSYAYGEMNVWGDSTVTANTIKVGDSGEAVFNQWGGVTGLSAIDVGTPKAEGRAALNLYGGEIRGKTEGTTVSLSVGTAANETGDALLAGGKLMGSSLALGRSDGTGSGVLTMAGGEASFTGNAAVNTGSTLKFVLGADGFGELNIGGDLTNGAAVEIGMQDALAFSSFSPTGTAQVLTVTGSGTPTVTNTLKGVFNYSLSDSESDSGNDLTLSATESDFGNDLTLFAIESDSGNDLTLSMNSAPGSDYLGVYEMNSGTKAFSSGKQIGWMEISGMGNDPYVLSLDFDGVDAGNQDSFVNWLDENTVWDVSKGDTDHSVLLQGLEEVPAKVFFWDLSGYNALGNNVALAGFEEKSVPEPATCWLLLGMLGMLAFWKRKKSVR